MQIKNYLALLLNFLEHVNFETYQPIFSSSTNLKLNRLKIILT
jgi:hypothetical protein